MITDAILEALLTVAKFFWGLMPTWTIATPTALGDFVSEMSIWDKLAPFSEMMTVSGIVVTVTGVFWAFKAVKWVIDLVRG